MKRTTIEKPAGEMNMVELAHNCMYAKAVSYTHLTLPTSASV